MKFEERDIKVDFIDPLVYKLPLLDKMHKELSPNTVPEPLEKHSSLFIEFDGFMVVTG
jgi:hypothetical protein